MSGGAEPRDVAAVAAASDLVGLLSDDDDASPTWIGAVMGADSDDGDGDADVDSTAFSTESLPLLLLLLGAVTTVPPVAAELLNPPFASCCSDDGDGEEEDDGDDDESSAPVSVDSLMLAKLTAFNSAILCDIPSTLAFHLYFLQISIGVSSNSLFVVTCW